MAGVTGLLAVACALLHRYCRREEALTIPFLLLIPAVLLTGLLIQIAIGRLVFPQLGVLYACYVLWAALLMFLGRYLADVVGLSRFVEVLAVAIALTATLGAVITIAQWMGETDRAPWIFPYLGRGGYSNIGQANHHAHYSWLGIASALYLQEKARLSRAVLWSLLPLICFGSVLSGSRSVFLYLLVLLAVLAWRRYQNSKVPVAKLWSDAIFLVPVLITLNFVGSWAAPRVPEFHAWLHGIPQAQSAGYNEVQPNALLMPGVRLRESVSEPSERAAVARGAWAAFTEHPWLGQGASNFRWASFMASVERDDDTSIRVGEHAHNVVLQLLAEFGAPVTVMVLLLVIVWMKAFLRQPGSLEHYWCAAVLGIGAVHSLLEYPLWYSYFLGPTALLLGATSSGRSVVVSTQRGAAYLCLVAVSGVLILGNLLSDYRKMEVATNLPFALHADPERAWRISMDHVLQVHRDSLLSPWALWTLVILAEPSRQQAQDRADLCERGIRFSPARWLVTRCAMQLALAGRDQDARHLILAVLRAYPAERGTTIEELAKGGRAYPEIEPLWRASLGK